MCHRRDAAELVDGAAAAGVPLTVFQNRRWDSDFLTLSRLAAAGQLGEIKTFESRFERLKPLGANAEKAWRALPPAEAGGVVYDLGSHLVDQTIQLMGPVIDIYAEIVSFAGSAAPDDGYLELTHAGGADRSSGRVWWPRSPARDSGSWVRRAHSSRGVSTCRSRSWPRA